ncbi:MAG: hypothetical protein H8D45_20855 [Bacteroidetes bacterium]|nr:hypothetical protein [Bacteroidota bacterium]
MCKKINKAIEQINSEIKSAEMLIKIFGEADSYWAPYMNGLQFALEAIKNCNQNTTQQKHEIKKI